MPNRKHHRRLVLSPERINQRVSELAAELEASLDDSEPVFLGILKGSFIFLSDLVRAMNRRVQVDFIRLASYGTSTNSSGSITMHKPPEMDLKDRIVVVVEDIVDTGLTLRWLVDHLADYHPRRVLLCSLIDKPERREAPVEIDFVGFRIPDGFLVGYGLDYNEQYRELPGVYTLEFDEGSS